MTYPNAALTAVCLELLDEWGFTPEQIKNLAADIPGECEGILEGHAAFEARQTKETGHVA